MKEIFEFPLVNVLGITLFGNDVNAASFTPDVDQGGSED